MLTLDEVVRLTDDMFAAAMGEESWDRPLTDLAEMLGHDAVSMEVHDTRRGRMLHHHAVRLDPASMGKYRRDFAQDNPRVAFLRKGLTRISHDHLFMSETDMDGDRFYADFLAPMGLRYFLSAESDLDAAGVKGVIALQRSGRVSGADDDSLTAMAQLEPIFARALRLFWTRQEFRINPAAMLKLLRSYGLTDGESRLAQALASGDSLRTYAQQAGITMNTVYTHYARVKAKLDCRDQAALVRRLAMILRGREI